MEPTRGECQALLGRPEREVCSPQFHLLHLPQHFSHLEARKTDTDDNAKPQKKKDGRQPQLFAASRMRTSPHPVFKQAEERPSLRSPGWKHRCPRSKKRHFFIAQSRSWPRPYISYGRNLQTCLNRSEQQASPVRVDLLKNRALSSRTMKP